MKPYFDDGTVTIYHGDCAVIAPQLGQFDLLCTDPPYGIGEARNKRGGKRHGKAAVASRDYGASDWDDEPPASWVLDMCRAQATHSIIFGGNYFSLPPSSCWLVWDKENGDNGYADCELAWTNLPIAVRRKRHLWHGMLRKNGEEREHPTQKPLEVMSWGDSTMPRSPIHRHRSVHGLGHHAPSLQRPQHPLCRHRARGALLRDRGEANGTADACTGRCRMIAFVSTLLMLWPLPDFRLRVDRRECDGERYVVACVGLYQQPETWTCVEVARG